MGRIIFFNLWASMDPRTLPNRAAAARGLGANELMRINFPFIYSLTAHWLPLMTWAWWVNIWAVDGLPSGGHVRTNGRQAGVVPGMESFSQ